jgi:hypothetical protein
MRHLKLQYTEVLSIPTYERRYFLTSFINEKQKKHEQMEEQNGTTSSGKGKRTTKVSGQQLKTKLQNGDIPSH